MSIELVEEGCLPVDRLAKPNCDVRIYVDTERFIPDTKLQIYLQLEPEAIRPIRQYLLTHSYLYNTIFTFDSEVLKQCSNARKFTFYTPTWLHEDKYTKIDTTMKAFGISTVVGFKSMTEGHKIRHNLYFSQQGLHSLPILFFRSCTYPLLPAIRQNPILESKDITAKYVLFETFQFHLTIENSRQENYFTEKLIDCLVTKTIPIYYGCPNIGEYFDTTGWILLQDGTAEELLSKCRVLTPSYYSQYSESIDVNYKKAMEWKENLHRLNTALVSIPGYV